MNSKHLMRVAVPRRAVIALKIDRFFLRLYGLDDNVSSAIDLDFSRLRHVQLCVHYNYTDDYDRAIIGFLERRNRSSGLVQIFVSPGATNWSYGVILPRLLAYLA